YKKHQRPEIASIDQFDHDERHKRHAQKRQLIGSSKDLGELHTGPLLERAADFVAAAREPLDGVDGRFRIAAGSRPVLASKRCDSDGRLPSGRSSSMRSMRCMGKKTTAGVNGSLSFTITAKSSKDASSIPLRL